MRGAEFACAVRELRFEDIDGDDRARASDARALDSCKPDAAATENGDRRARLDLSGVERRADARRHAAADERGRLHGHVLADLHDRVFVERASSPRSWRDSANWTTGWPFQVNFGGPARLRAGLGSAEVRLAAEAVLADGRRTPKGGRSRGRPASRMSTERRPPRRCPRLRGRGSRGGHG